MRLKEDIAKKRPQMKKKNALSPRQYIVSQVDRNEDKLHDLHLELLPHSPYPPDLILSNYWQFAKLKRMLQGKRFGSIEEVISETKLYFEAKDKSFYKKASNC